LRPTLVFSHANGFPAGTYRLLFDRWQAAGWHVLALPRIGHDPAYPVTPNWPHLREELAQFVRSQAPGQRVHLVGHSLGGFLSLMLACRHPELAQQVVMLDSPVIGGWRSHSATAAKALGLFRRLSPGRVSERRRHRWPSREAALAHFAAKSAFARWDERVLRDYIAHGTEPDPTPDLTPPADTAAPAPVRLAFRREVETHIYDTLPVRLGALLQRHPPQVPVHFLAGTRSAELRQAGLPATRALVRERWHWVEGTHLFPMEAPEATATAVLRCLGPA
jgi:pimeloyl-ACP methyl ester carboxylesterase